MTTTTKTYEILIDICKLNPTITHFCLRLYKTDTTLLDVADDEFQYEWISILHLKKITDIIEYSQNQGWHVGLTSMVMTTSGIQHLLMIDYLIEHSSQAEGDIQWKLSTFNQSGDVPYKLDGYIIKTNNSYHYLGKYCTSEANFINFLGSALLFRNSGEANIVDDIWLGRSVKRRFGALRLGQKDGIYPTVIAEVK